MTTTRLIANGSWSNPAIFLGGVTPPAGATVYANGFVADIDASVNLGGPYCPQVAATAMVADAYYMIETVGTTNFISFGAATNTPGVRFRATGAGTGTGSVRATGTLTNLAGASASAGGGFTVSTSQVIAADIRSGSGVCLTITGTGSPTIDGNGVFSTVPVRAFFAPSSTTGAHAIVHGGSGLLTLQSASGVNSTGVSIHGLLINGGGSVLVIGGNYATISSVPSSVFQVSNGFLTVQDNTILNASGAIANTPSVINIAASASLIINNSIVIGGGPNSSAIVVAGSVTGSGNTFTGGYAMTFSGTPSVNLSNNTYSANASGPAIYSILTNATLSISGAEIDHSSGFTAVVALRRNYGNATPTGSYREGRLSSGAAFTLGDAAYALFGQPAPADVRSGTSYANGQLIGAMPVVSPTPQQIWEYATRTLTDKTGFELTSTERTAISTQIERTGGPLDTASDTLAALQPRLQDAATTAGVAEIVTTALSAM